MTGTRSDFMRTRNTVANMFVLENQEISLQYQYPGEILGKMIWTVSKS